MTQPASPPAVSSIAEALSLEMNADVLMLNGAINDESFEDLDACIRMRKHDNVILSLMTLGGNPHAGYRIARALKRNYERVTILVSGMCKSAGTLVALGADELVMTDAGELGPLDIQLWSREHFGERDSANDMTYGLAHIGVEATSKFFECFGALASEIETKVAAEAATKLVGCMYGRVFEAAHPRHVGAIVRSNQIGCDYATRLMPPTPDSAKAIRRLVYEYPAHDFVIDREEAQEFLHTVRQPHPLEAQLTNLLPRVVFEKACVLRLAPPPPPHDEERGEDDDDAITIAATHEHEPVHREPDRHAEGADGISEGDRGGGTKADLAQHGPRGLPHGPNGQARGHGALSQGRAIPAISADFG